MFNKSIHKRWLLGIFVVGVSALFGNSAPAQITPDRTLPNNSIVTPNGSTLNITGGTQAGANLFHSFREFSVPTGYEAFFNNGVDISNIISRVTGPNPSNIDGLIRTLGKANLFVINPNGIVFGPNARLNVGGSFVATTANAIQFGNQGFFSADVPNNPALLTINPNALLFNQIAAASIQNQSTALVGKNPVTRMDANGLRVRDGKSLLLVGGDINMDGGKLVAFGGRVELLGLAATGTVGLNVDGNLLSLSFPNNLDLASVSLSNNSNVDVSGGSGSGSITINARNLTFANSGLTVINAGNVNINARNAVWLEDGSYLSAATNGNGNAGNVTINAGDSVSLKNHSSILSEVQDNAQGYGNAGSVTINAGDSVSLNNSNIQSNVGTNAKGNGGVISINTKALSLTNNAQLYANTDGAGSAGSVKLNASDRVSLENRSSVQNTVSSNTMGNSGGISITTGTLSLTNGSYLNTSTSGQANIANSNAMGNSGGISITTGTLSLTGAANLFANTNGNANAGSVSIYAGDSVSLNNSNIQSNVGTNSKGNGGVISINTKSLSLTNNAQLSANTDGSGSAGSVTINASDRVSLENNSAVYNLVNSNAMGNSGGISITTGTLSLTNRSQLNTTTSGQANIANSNAMGNSGGISITTGTLSLTEANLYANTNGTANAGSVTINASDGVSLDGSNIQRNVGTNSKGNGGVISINAKSLSLTNNAQLSANTDGSGSAGSVTINASDRVSLENKSSVQNTVSSNAMGDSGGISITTGTLSLTNDSSLNTSTSGQGNGGDIILDARDRVSLDNSNLFTSVGNTATGKGGNLKINSRDISFANGTILTLGTSGKGDAGNATITTQSLSLTNGSQLITRSNSTANAGNIHMQIGDLLLLRRQSIISSSAGNAEAGGNGGNINIQAPNGFVIAVPNQSSDITADAFSGSGGKIQIRATGIFGLSVLSTEDSEKRFGKYNLMQGDLQQLLQQQPTNVITAISQQNPDLSGTVQINTPNVDPSRGLVQLPTKSADSLKLIDRSCAAFEGTQGSSFVVTGRGGLPPSPDEPLSADAVWSDTRLPITTSEHGRNKPPVQPSSKPKPVAIVPATGWVFNGKGEVTLISSAPNANPLGSTAATCPAR